MSENQYRNELYRLLTVALRRLLAVGPPTPVAPKCSEFIEETFMPVHEFKYTFGLPASAPDVAKFVVMVEVDGAVEQFELAATETTFAARSRRAPTSISRWSTSIRPAMLPSRALL
jgi:hypothetical protein